MSERYAMIQCWVKKSSGWRYNWYIFHSGSNFQGIEWEHIDYFNNAVICELIEHVRLYNLYLSCFYGYIIYLNSPLSVEQKRMTSMYRRYVLRVIPFQSTAAKWNIFVLYKVFKLHAEYFDSFKGHVQIIMISSDIYCSFNYEGKYFYILVQIFLCKLLRTPSPV